MITGRRRHLRCSAAGQTSNASTGVRALLSEQRRQTGRLHPRTMPAGPACREARSTGVHTEPCAISASPADEPAPASSDAAAAMLVPGRNCWRIERAERVAFLVDGEEYFTAVRSALAKARHSIFILGWDIDSRMRLVPDGANDGLPEPLGDFLNASRRASSRAARLRAVVGFRDALRDGARVAADLQARLAHASAVDLPPRRQASDRRVASPEDHRRRRRGRVRERLRPHAVPLGHERARVQGSAARRPSRRPVSAVSRRRYRRRRRLRARTWRSRVASAGCARRVNLPRRTAGSLAADAWPDGVAIEATSIDVAIARTEPAFDGRPGVAEIRSLHLDAIAGAKRHIFAENQYFTSRTIAEAFARRLRGGRRARDRRAVAVHAKRLARDFHDGRVALAHSSHAACGGPRRRAIVSTARCCAGSATARAASTCTARC